MSTTESSPVGSETGDRSRLAARVVASADGTPIEYFSLGRGPGIVIVHGAMQCAASQRDLAELLAGEFTVHLINRRGRGRSGSYTALNAYSTAIDVADVEAVVADARASGVLGISSGAVISAEVGRRHPELCIALFEPPFVVDDSLDLSFLPRFDREVAAGDVPSYMITAMLGAQMGPSFLRYFPRRMLRSMTAKMLAKDAVEPLPEAGAHLRDLAASLPYDFAIIRDHVDRIDDFAGMPGELLLISGTGSPRYLRQSVDELGRRNPTAVVRIIDGADHSGTQNSAERGKPEQAAAVLRPFFASAAANSTP